MKKLYIFLATNASITVILGISQLGSASQFPDLVFSDVSNDHPNMGAIKYLKEKGIVKGYPSTAKITYPEGEFRPDNTLNRAEFFTVLGATFFPKATGANCFPDVKDEWFAKYVCIAKNKGLTSGFRDGTFKPSLNISFAEATVILTKTFGIKPVATAKSDHWYKGYTKALELKKAIPTSIDYMEKKLSRADMAEMVWRLKTGSQEKPTKTYEALVSPFPSIASCDELKEKYLAYNYSNRWRGEKGGGGGAFQPSSFVALSETSGKASTQTETDYSSTNVQVEGVDEADVIKNDSKYIYVLRGASLRIVQANPPEQMKEIAKIEFPGNDKGNNKTSFNPLEMYVANDKITVVGNMYENYISRTRVMIYDIKDKGKPELLRTLDFDGYSLSSRRIGDKIYFVLNSRPSIDYDRGANGEFNGAELLPKYFDSKTGRNKTIVSCNEISFYPQHRDLEFLVVASVSLDNPERDPVKTEVFMGGGNTIYASSENLFVTTLRYEYDELMQYNVWQPPIQKTSTVIFRFSLDDGSITYKGQGAVPGAILNQFSMDEYKDAFRLTTTTGSLWDKKDPSQNHLYVLDINDLNKILGKVEGIAKGEKIYSTRFAGDKAYMVTFKKVDPFFVIDVSDHANPKVLGALKIPGYSDYLHPYDENHIIGFGKNAATPEEEESKARDIDFAWYQGMKIGLFDVTDPTNPVQKFEELIGDRGTDSEILYNHKALLFSKVRSLLSFPVSLYEIKDKKPGTYTGSLYGEFVFQGAYVYTLDLEKGFQLKSRITNQEPNDKKITDPYGWFYQNDNVTRIIQIGDYLYTVSDGKIKAISIGDMSEKNVLKFEGDDPAGPSQYYY